MLEFSVSNQTLTRLDATAVVSDSQNYLDCSFQFSEDWEGVEAVATFGHKDVAEPISVPVVNGVCRVPHEVIHPYGFYLAVYGTGEAEEGIFTHIPTGTVTVEVAQAGVSEGLSPFPATADLFDQLSREIRESQEACVAAKTSALASAQAAAGAEQGAGAARNGAQTAAAQARVSASAAALDAQGARGSAGDASAAADRAQAAASAVQGAVEGANTALTGAREAAQSAAASATSAGAAEVNAQSWAEQGAYWGALNCSYTQGADSYQLLGGVLGGLRWTDGEEEIQYLGLRPGLRYEVKVDGVTYVGVAHRQAEAATLAPPGATPEDPIVDPGGEQQAEFGDPYTGPAVPGVVVLQGGAVTLRDVFEGLEGNNTCVMTTTDTAVQSVEVYNDAHLSSRYYLEQCKACLAACQALAQG